MSIKNKKNTTVELLRFVFCIIIILYHINNRLEIQLNERFTFFSNGRIGVEFFFLVSGYLMAKSSIKYKDGEILPSTKDFIFKKFNAILPYHLIVYFCCVLIMARFSVRLGSEELFRRFCETLPNFFFLQKSGIISVEIMTSEWYIAAMLWMMLIIFPLILKYGEKFTKLACPLITILIIGYMIHDNHQLGGTRRFIFDNIFPKAYARAFAEMCGGVFCFEASEYIKKLNFKAFDKFILTVIELICYILPIVYSFSSWERDYESFAFYSIAIAITISFSEASYSANALYERICCFLGKMSLPIYMSQSIPFTLYRYSNRLKAVSDYKLVIFFLTSTIIIAFAIELIKPFMTGIIHNKVRRLKTNAV